MGTRVRRPVQLAGIGLLLTSAWLIVRAAEQPPVLYLMVAIVSVRFWGCHARPCSTSNGC
ncbi:hypothetical protein [Aeromicrobium sp. UC242_57]|uniref:hypothetical protein n=1 Tax=Aeromicrobium sp. UC242_57 TaxID=3374624 RepID=UPI0037A3ABC8